MKAKTKKSAEPKVVSEYKKLLDLFQLGTFPPYSDPNEFAQRFERCSVLRSDAPKLTVVGSAAPIKKK